MYAVVTTGGKQYRVEAGIELLIERLAADEGSSITFDRVLLVGDGDAVTVGTPTVDGASVSATVLGEALGPKLAVFKFKQKVKYRRMAGHRQHLLRVRIDEISASGRRSKAEPKTAAPTSDEAPKRGKAEPTEEKPKRTRASGTKAATGGRAAASGSSEERPKRTRRSPAKSDATQAEE